MNKKLLFIIKALLLAVVFYFVYQQLNKNWAEITDYDWSINWLYLVGSVGMHLLTLLFFSAIWKYLIKGFGYDVPLAYAFKISYISNLGRYIPGKFWQVVGMAYIAKKMNIKEESAVASWAIAMMFALPSAFLAGLVCILSNPEIFPVSEKVGMGVYLATAAMFLISLVLIFSPEKSLALYNFFLRKIKREPVEFKLTITDALKIYIGYIFCWLSYGVSFWLFVISITGNFDFPLLSGVGAFVIAYQIGYLAIFTPGGLGVRELTLVTIISPTFGTISTGIAIASRIWNLVTEILAAIIAFLIKIKK